MTYIQRIVNDRPSNFFPLNPGPNAFVGQMGGFQATVNGSPVSTAPLVVGGGVAYQLNGTDNFRFSSIVFHEDSPQKPFTLEAWFKPISVNGPKAIIGHSGQADGLSFDGEQISFSTWHSDAGKATVSFYPLSTTGSFHVVGVHTGSKNELYVNGVRVGAVDLTEEQLNTPYEITSNPGYLSVGHLPGSIIVDGVAAYAKGLTSRDVKLHFLWGRDVQDYQEVVTARNGTYWTFTDDTADVLFEYKFDTAEEWSRGESAQVVIRDDSLYPAIDSQGLTIGGTWLAGGIIESLGNNIAASKIEWDSDGPVTIQTSLDDGGTWQNAANGRMVPSLRQGYETAGRSLIFRAVFDGGLPAEPITALRSLSIVLYASKTPEANVNNAEFLIVGDASLASKIYQPLEQDDRFGIDFYNDGSGRVSSMEGFRTIEFWIKANTTQGNESWNIIDNRTETLASGASIISQNGTSNWTLSGGTMYVNGVKTNSRAALSLIPGRWYHVVLTISAANTRPLLLNVSKKQLAYGFLALYPQVMTDEEVTGLYNSQVGVVSHRIIEESGLSIQDSAAAVSIYAHDWSLLSSG